MSVTFPEIRVGDPIRHEGLAVCPLFAEPSHGVDYGPFQKFCNMSLE